MRWRRRSGGAAAASARGRAAALELSCAVMECCRWHTQSTWVSHVRSVSQLEVLKSKRCSLWPGWRTATVRQRPIAEGQQATILIDALAQQLPQVQPMLALHVLHRCLQGQSKSVCLAREYLHALAALPCSSTQKTQKGLAGWLHQGSALHSCCSENMPCQFIMAHLPKLRGAQA